MVTFNVADFARITAEWAAASRSHAGCLLIVGIDHAEFGPILRVVEHAFSTRPEQESWIEYTSCGTRSAIEGEPHATLPLVTENHRDIVEHKQDDAGVYARPVGTSDLP